MGLNTTPATWSSGAMLTAAQLNLEVRDALTGVQAAWTSWTPTVTSGLTVGNGVWTAGSYLQVGKSMTARFMFTLGTTSAVTGPIVLQFPIRVAASYGLTENCGFASLVDVSAGAAGRFSATTQVVSAAGGGVGTFTFSGSITGTQLNATNPFTWASTDSLSGTLIYEAA